MDDARAYLIEKGFKQVQLRAATLECSTSHATMIYLSRAQIGKCTNGIDITVRSDLIVSPDWNHVYRYKRGSLTESQYTDWYLTKLDRNSNEVHEWAKLLSPHTVFLCYVKIIPFATPTC